MNIPRRTLFWAIIIFTAGTVIGCTATLLINDKVRHHHQEDWTSAARLEIALLRQLNLRPEQQSAAIEPVTAAAQALLTARRQGETNSDAILSHLAADLAGILDQQQRDDLKHRLVRRTQQWQSHIAPDTATDPRSEPVK